MTTSILKRDMTLEIFSVSQSTALGYVHTSAKNTAAGADAREEEEVQRWYLKSDLFEDFFPGSTCVLQQPTDSAWRLTDRASFVSKVRSNIQDTGERYVKVNCRSISPATATATFTRPAFLTLVGALGGSQGDIGTAQIRKINGELIGYVYTEELSSNQRYECWALDPTFRTVDPADRNTHVSLGLPIKFKDLESFATLMFKGGLPTPGSSFWCLAVQYLTKEELKALGSGGQDW